MIIQFNVEILSLFRSDSKLQIKILNNISEILSIRTTATSETIISYLKLIKS